MHAPLPATANLPAAQLVHTPPAAANLPAAQLLQSLSAPDPTGEDLPAAQSLHDCGDCAAVDAANLPALQLMQAPPPAHDLKLPAAHAWHALPSTSPEYPALHQHAAVLPFLVVADTELAGHGGAAVHACVPAAPLNVPAAHGAHAQPHLQASVWGWANLPHLPY